MCGSQARKDNSVTHLYSIRVVPTGELTRRASYTERQPEFYIYKYGANVVDSECGQYGREGERVTLINNT